MRIIYEFETMQELQEFINMDTHTSKNKYEYPKIRYYNTNFRKNVNSISDDIKQLNFAFEKGFFE